MKKAIVVIFALVIMASCTKDNGQEMAKKLYETAQKNLDPNTAKVALNQLLIYDSTNLVNKDSLARLYMQTGNYKAGTDLAQVIIESGSPDTKLIETTALAYQQLGEKEKAEGLVDMLMSNTDNPKYLYQKMVLQYEKGDVIMFDSISNQLLSRIETDSLAAKQTILLPDPASGANQNIPIKAATLFVIGNNAFEKEKDVRKAVNYFQQSVQEYDQFQMARYYLTEIARMQQGR